MWAMALLLLVIAGVALGLSGYPSYDEQADAAISNKAAAAAASLEAYHQAALAYVRQQLCTTGTVPAGPITAAQLALPTQYQLPNQITACGGSPDGFGTWSSQVLDGAGGAVTVVTHVACLATTTPSAQQIGTILAQDTQYSAGAGMFLNGQVIEPDTNQSVAVSFNLPEAGSTFPNGAPMFPNGIPVRYSDISSTQGLQSTSTNTQAPCLSTAGTAGTNGANGTTPTP